ncbi:MAG: M23 family metallopeptidase, partial [Saprospiraceae bacterium]|nr:M23 family metallopeptidase [Saprospiraceae bacterium]
MKALSLVLSLIFSISLSGQDYLEIFEEPRNDGSLDLLALNHGPVPLTLEVDFNTLRNLKADVSLPHQIVIPTGAEPTRLMGLRVTDRRKSPEYDFRFEYAMGDINAEHDDSYVYTLPYKKGTSHLVHQGYHGRYSHKNAYAIDFSMPVGTEVYAARGGVVANIKEDSNTGCKNPSCQGKANYLVIGHDDGSFSNYVHLKYNGILVEVGERVEQGQLVALSGNTGWS